MQFENVNDVTLSVINMYRSYLLVQLRKSDGV